MNKRTLGIGILLLVVGFYTFGTGFTFFFHFFYALLLLLALGFAWAWLNLQGLDVRLIRNATRGQVGGYLEARIEVSNRTRMPKSWLEISEVTDLPVESPGKGLALVKQQNRTWRIETYLTRRGVFKTGQVQVISQDPFGLFVLRRNYLEPQEYIVVPATHPLPDLHPQLGSLPVDGRHTKSWDQVTTDVSTVREYAYGDSYRRIHWPYTARMNSLMVKEFDVGISAESWVVLDMQQGAHYGAAPANTEELSVTVAASLVSRIYELSLPVGLACNGEFNYVVRPDSSPENLGHLMETLAAVKALGQTPAERFLYELRPNLSRYSTLVLVTPSLDTAWVPALNALRRQGVRVAAVLIDSNSFGNARADVNIPLAAALRNEIPCFMVKAGQDLNAALAFPLTWEGETEPSPDTGVMSGTSA